MPLALTACRPRLLGLLLLPLATPAAALQISLQPQPLRAGDDAILRLDSRPCAMRLPSVVTPQRVGTVLVVTVYPEDTCDSRLPGEIRDLPLGRLPIDIELVRVLSCAGNAPPGVDPCYVALQAPVLPGTALTAPQPVPLSPAALGAGSLLVMLLGARRWRAARRG